MLNSGEKKFALSERKKKHNRPFNLQGGKLNGRSLKAIVFFKTIHLMQSSNRITYICCFSTKHTALRGKSKD